MHDVLESLPNRVKNIVEAAVGVIVSGLVGHWMI